MLPPLYGMDNFTNCIQNGNVYCKIKANLQSSVNDSEVWRCIENSLQNKRRFKRDALFRAICVPEEEASEYLSIKNFSESVVNKKIEQFNLTSVVDVLGCTDGSISRSFYDYFVLTMVILYGILLAFATYQDIRKKNIDKDEGLLCKFSLRYNWKRRTRSIKNVDCEKLMSIQGIRFYATMILLLVHTQSWYTFSFIENPAAIEEWLVQPISLIFQSMIPFWVLVFLMISSWLLTVQVCHIYRRHGEFNLKHVALQIIHRYFRIVVVLGVIIMLTYTSWMSFLSGPNNFDYFLGNISACKKNWYATLLFFNNFFRGPNVCMFISWYLSADFQMYVVNTLILYVIFKYKLDEMKVFLSLLFINSAVYGIMIYIYKTDVVFKTTIRNLEHGDGTNSMAYFVIYSSPISNWSSSCIGMILGTLYYKIGDKSIQLKDTWKFLFTPIFLIFPLAAATITIFDFEGIGAAILGILVKPMFVFGIGIGILEMSQNVKGIIKKIFVWKPVILLSNFSYCIYLCQLICFMKPHNSLSTFGILKLMGEFVCNALIIIAVAIILTLTVEEPGITLQKMLLPKVEKYANNNCKKMKPN